MILHKVVFGTVPRGKRQEAEDSASRYIADLRRNGQACGEWILAVQGGQLCAYVYLSGIGALSTKNRSEYEARNLDDVVSIFNRSPEWTVADDDAPKRDTTWNKAPFLFLYTDHFDEESPLCRGDNGRPIPVYRLPGTHEERQEVVGWQSQYHEYDSIWMDCGPLEIPTYRQLACVDGELSKRGRAICARIESVTGIATFYYLYRYWGRKNAEEARRPCPGCGNPWRTAHPIAKRCRFRHFPFQCADCRLVSNMAYSDDDSRHARIGEWRKPRVSPKI